MGVRSVVLVGVLLCQLVTAALCGTMGHAVIYVNPTITGTSGDNPIEDRGYFGGPTGIVEFPNVLALDPGGESWPNFVAAARSSVEYHLDNIVLTRTVPPQLPLCQAEPSPDVTQSGSDIRLWWPLLYELPGTTFTLTLNYSTPAPLRLTGESSESIHHTETWVWKVAVTGRGVSGLLTLMHDLPVGASDTSLVWGDLLYGLLQSDMANVDELRAAGDSAALTDSLDTFGARLMEHEFAQPPAYPMPAEGVTNTPEDPAVPLLLVWSEALAPVDSDSLSKVLMAYNDTPVSIAAPLTVTLTGGNWWCYVQNDERTAGMKVTSIPGVSPGARVILEGVLKSSGAERTLAAKSTGVTVVADRGPIPGALHMPMRSVGGSYPGCSAGFVGAPGLWNGGLLISVAGVVTASEPNWFYVDDGSGLLDSTSHRGLRVILPQTATAPPIGSFVAVTGVSSSFSSGSSFYQPALFHYPALQMSHLTVLAQPTGL